MFARFSLSTLASARSPVIGFRWFKICHGCVCDCKCLPPCVSCDRLAICGSWDGLHPPPCDSDKQKKMDGYSYLI